MLRRPFSFVSSLRVNKFVFSRSEDFSTKNSCSFHNSTFQQLQSSELQMRTIIRKFNVKHFSVAGDRVRQHTWKQVGWETMSNIFLAYLTYLLLLQICAIFGIFDTLNCVSFHLFLLHCSETEADKAHLPKCIRREVLPSILPFFTIEHHHTEFSLQAGLHHLKHTVGLS